jgi:retron-type reverse transcriptase
MFKCLLREVQYEVTVPTVSDRLLQRAVARIFEAVFEADFLECSYGFRPGLSPHHALRATRADRDQEGAIHRRS